MVKNNLYKIQNQFNWEKIIDQYEEYILDCFYHSRLNTVVSGHTGLS